MLFCAEYKRRRGEGKGNKQERKTDVEKTKAEIEKSEEKVRENCIKSLRKSDGDVLLAQPKERVSLCF